MPNAMLANNAEHDALWRFLEDRGVDPQGVVDKLEAYEALIRRWNTRQNLISRRDIGRLRVRHVHDSLALLPWWSGRLADVGAGAGLPGVPLAIARPASAVTLIERSERKVRFLTQVVLELELRNVEIIACDVTELSRSNRYPCGALFDTVTARALVAPPAAWKLVRSLIEPEGAALFQSGARLSPALFEGGTIRRQERSGETWVTVVGRSQGAS